MRLALLLAALAVATLVWRARSRAEVWHVAADQPGP